MIGIQQIDHYPHYDITRGELRGFAGDLFRRFAREYDLDIRYIPMPVKRLFSDGQAETIDFIYPDNPKWQALREGDDGRYYSHAVVSILGVALVKPEHVSISLPQVRSLSIVRGFTPTKWLSVKPNHNFEFIEVNDSLAAALMVLKGRVTVAEGEYNVIMHQLSQLGLQDSLVVAPNLPVSRVSYHLSTVRELDRLNQFNQFLTDHQVDIQQLMANYGLKTDLPELAGK
ncbi:hypothetical protein GCM10027098_18870 [Bowmanella dokdonensis]